MTQSRELAATGVEQGTRASVKRLRHRAGLIDARVKRRLRRIIRWGHSDDRGVHRCAARDAELAPGIAKGVFQPRERLFRRPCAPSSLSCSADLSRETGFIGL